MHKGDHWELNIRNLKSNTRNAGNSGVNQSTSKQKLQRPIKVTANYYITLKLNTSIKLRTKNHTENYLKKKP